MAIADTVLNVPKTLSIACPVTLLSLLLICSRGIEALREVYGSKEPKRDMRGSFTMQTKTTLQETKRLILYQMILAFAASKRAQAPTSLRLHQLVI